MNKVKLGHLTIIRTGKLNPGVANESELSPISSRIEKLPLTRETCRIRLGDVCGAEKETNRDGSCTDVYSVTNSLGFVPSGDYFNKEVFSSELKNYRVVKRGMLAYNPSRIDVGSVALQDKMDRVVVSPLYVVFSVDKSRILPDYLLAFLKSDAGLAQIAASTIGTVRNNLKFDRLCDLEIMLPNLETQRYRVRLMEKMERLAELAHQQIFFLDNLVKSRFIEMFGPNEGSVRLSTVCTLYNGDRGKNYPSGKDRVEEGIPFVNAGDLVDGRISFEKMDYITEERYKLLSGGKIERGDILYCLRGTLGKCAITDFSGGTIASSMMIIRPNQNKVLPAYLYQVLASPLVEKQLQSSRNGSTQPNLSAKSVGNYVIPLPHINRQREFTDFVARIDKLRFDVQQQIEKLDTLKKSLMQEYFG